MSFLALKGKNNQDNSTEDMLRQMDMQYAQIAIELEKLKNLKDKVQKIDSKLNDLERVISSGGFKVQTHPITSKTKEAIRLILQKYGDLTSEQLSKLIKLSRTRCNEYLKEMESEGATVSKIECRKRLYSLRQ
jgi:response regulator of citrate/malate metabolism